MDFILNVELRIQYKIVLIFKKEKPSRQNCADVKKVEQGKIATMND